MSNDRNLTLCSVLATQTREWEKWFKFLDGNLPQAVFPTAENVVRLLRYFLSAPEVSGTNLLKAIRQKFAIERFVGQSERGSPLPGQGWIRISRGVGELFGRETQIAVGEATASRRRSVEAHEIGHVFYATLAERTAKDRVDHMARTEEAERFCWNFAIEILCPRVERALWTAAYLKDVIRPEEEALVSQIEPRELRRLTYWHIRSLAQRHGISMRMVVMALDRHPLLDEVCFGIAVLKQMPNPATLRDIGLRVWQCARPDWGYLVARQRAVKQGFSFAETVFANGAHQEAVVYNERLRIKYSCPSEKIKWPTCLIETTCAYTPVDVGSEGRYLVVMWPWPRNRPCRR